MTLDITEQKRLAAAAAETEKHLALAVDGAGLATWFYDSERGVIGGDRKMSDLFGLAGPERPAEVWLDAVHEEDRERVNKEFAAGVEGAPYDTEYRVRKKDGSICWVHARAQLIVTATGLRMAGLCEDFTERRKNEENLRNTATRLSLAQRTGKMSSWQWDLASGNFVWDEGSIWTYGRPPSEMSHVDVIFPYLHEDDRERVRQDLQPAVQGQGDYTSEFRVIWPDGSLHWLQAFGKSVFSPGGKPIAIVGINMDTTERKLAEAALMQTEKLAAVGRLASSIAHEINNPLESVTNLLYLARNASDAADISNYLELADRELKRASAITGQTLRFYKQTTYPSEMNPSELFKEILVLYHGRLVNSKVKVEVRERARQPVACFVGEIRQVLSNLIGNAIDAMPGGGRLSLRSREVTNWKTRTKGLALTVADSGTGMPQRVREKIFEAFFTTKGLSGTGLGLWVSKELVERNHGVLSVRSSMSANRHGTVFVLFLPFAIDAAT